MRERLEELGVGARLALFALVLVVTGTAAAALGAASGLAVDEAAPGSAMAMAEHGGPDATGLATAVSGYSFEPDETAFGTGRTSFRFRIVGPDGAAARDFDREGGVRLHLIVVRRDLTGYRHLHPAAQPDGSWLVPLTFEEPGAYRAYADFEVGGRKIVLGLDLLVAGAMTPLPLPAPVRSVRAGEYTVELAGGPVRAHDAASLRFTVRRDRVPVTGFQDYVGMRGHLIALHEGDLAYTHIHALAEQAPGRIDFDAELEAAGSYRLFLQFKLEGRVVTAPFTIRVTR